MGACLSRRASAEVGPERYAPGTSSHAAQEEYALVVKTLGATGRSSAEVTVDDEIEVQGDQTVEDMADDEEEDGGKPLSPEPARRLSGAKSGAKAGADLNGGRSSPSPLLSSLSGLVSRRSVGDEDQQRQAQCSKLAGGSNDLDRYRVLQEIGRGLFSTVHLCIDTQSGRPVALKTIDERRWAASNRRRRRSLKMDKAQSEMAKSVYDSAQRAATEPAAIEAFASSQQASRERKDSERKDSGCNEEMEIMQRLRHAHIAALYATLHDAKRMYLVLEFLPGGPLLGGKALDALKPLAAAEVRRHAHDALSGLAYLHGAGVVHGDIKPSNLLLTSCGRLKIADFGVSVQRAAAPRASGPGAVADEPLLDSTPLFTAPELLAGSSAEPPVDLWALGVTLWLALCGEAPFRSGTLRQLYEAIETLPIPAPQTDDALGAEFLLELLTRAPAARLDADGALAHAWLGAEAWEPLALAAESADAPPPPRGGRAAWFGKKGRARRLSDQVTSGLTAEVADST